MSEQFKYLLLLMLVPWIVKVGFRLGEVLSIEIGSEALFFTVPSYYLIFCSLILGILGVLFSLINSIDRKLAGKTFFIRLINGLKVKCSERLARQL